LKENGVFLEGRVRMEKLNNLILLTTHGDTQHEGNKKRKESKFCSLSGMVPSAGVEPARFPTGV
jgi:site-specific DNA recombinase